MLDKEKHKILKFVRQDDLPGLYNYIQNRKKELGFFIAGGTLLHFVQSREMLAFLLTHNVNLFQKNKEGKSPEHLLARKIKSLLKERYFYKKAGAKIRAGKLADQIKKLRLTLQFLKCIKFQVMHYNRQQVNTFDAYKEILNAFKTGTFSPDISPELFMEMVDLCAYHSRKTKIYDEKTVSYLKRGGFNGDKIKKQRNLIALSGVDFYLSDDKNPLEPMLLFRGTINPKDKPEPLAHYGSLKAARERLDTLELAIKERRFEHLKKLGVNINRIVFSLTPVLLKVKNPFRLPELGEHKLHDYKRLMLHILLMYERGRWAISNLYQGGSLSSEFFKKNLNAQPLPKEYTYMFINPFKMPIEEVEKELLLGGLYAVEQSNLRANTINREHLCYQRMIRFFEKRGYDGFVYRNGWEDVGRDSYICFRPTSVVELKKATNRTLITPVQIDSDALNRLAEKEKIASQKSLVIPLDEAYRFMDYKMNYYYGVIKYPIMRPIVRAKIWMQNLLKNKLSLTR